MNAEQRRQGILERLRVADAPISASGLAAVFTVSRQIIVQDVAILRAAGEKIVASRCGYVLQKDVQFKRVFKVYHSDEDVERELNLIVDQGGSVEDVFVFHKVYGTVRAHLELQSRVDVTRFLRDIASGRSSLLKNVTSGYHYHTVKADNEEILEKIAKVLSDNGFLVPLQEYEPKGVKN